MLLAGGLCGQTDFTALKAVFVPGEKTVFYDDFTDMGPGDAPPHMKVRGPAPELKASGDLRQLTVTQRGSIFPNITSLPANFTFEAEIKVDGKMRSILNLILMSKTTQVLHFVTFATDGQCDMVASVRSPFEELGRRRFPVNWNEPAKVALWVQDGRLRAFVNGEKMIDANQVKLPAITGVELAHDFIGAGGAIGYRNVRFAESAPDFSQVLMSSGRYVTHGILFDTGSDRLKPESAAVIQMVAKGLQANAGLKLLIEGHTDSTGGAAQNVDLSKRRAEAVKTVLTAQFGIDAGRLATAGLGSGKPIDTNDTPLGRAQNRRVEFVKQ
jgi:outer membrane protein OmpA-like peptidoglycan-associated protein